MWNGVACLSEQCKSNKHMRWHEPLGRSETVFGIVESGIQQILIIQQMFKQQFEVQKNVPMILDTRLTL